MICNNKNFEISMNFGDFFFYKNERRIFSLFFELEKSDSIRKRVLIDKVKFENLILFASFGICSEKEKNI